MTDWKIRQEMYHRLNTEFDDDLENFDIQYRPDTILQDCVDYINKPSEDTGWMYPAKSYIVALVYASNIASDFNEDIYELLKDPELLYNNDPYYVTYDNDPMVYDHIINMFGLPLPSTGVIPDITKYYRAELMIT